MNYNNPYTMYKDTGTGTITDTSTGTNLTWIQSCDSCGTTPSTVYCWADSAYLCTDCDARVHVANRVASRHERVPVCEACERAPATLLCRADVAALCTACDELVHSANPLAGRHQRVPILPLPNFFTECNNSEINGVSSGVYKEGNDNEGLGMFGGGEVEDEFLDLDNLGQLNSCYDQNNMQNQSIHINQEQMMQKEVMNNEFVVPSSQLVVGGAVTEVSNVGYSCTASKSKSVSFSSIEASVVPDTTMTDISNCHLFPGSSIQTNPQFDREARVMRYKEKKKTRKFEKTVRYASRKAYAEARPRIKGRFANRSDIEHEVDQMFSQNVLADASYETVPWF
ncbi:hypothetical protein LUZ60_000155 [Juncus effusus]|nr:hypothetical protein LUZ60_000155 [Juncus effusus]